MDILKENLQRWQQYISRVLLLVICLLVFVGSKGECDCDEGVSPCGSSVEKVVDTVLTESNPSVKIQTDAACPYGGGIGIVFYQYNDIAPDNLDEPPPPDAAKIEATRKKEQPSITAKISVLEGGGQPGEKEPVMYKGNGLYCWREACEAPRIKEGTNPAPIHYVLTITMQKPLIKLPGKGPTIALPFIGQVIGPKPRDLHVKAAINYQPPRPSN